MFLFQVSMERKREPISKADQAEIKRLNSLTEKQIGEMNFKDISLTKNILEHAKPEVIGKAVFERYDNIFNMPYYDDISKEKLSQITKVYNSYRERKFSGTARITPSTIPKPMTGIYAEWESIQSKNKFALINASNYLSKTGPAVSLSEYTISNPQSTDAEKVNFMAKSKHDILVGQGKEKEAKEIMNNYKRIMQGGKV